MKKIVLALTLSLGLVSPLLAGNTNVLADDKSRLSYAIGMTFGYKWKQQGIDVTPELVLRGLQDVQAGGATLLTPQEMSEVLNQFQQKVAARRDEQRATIAAKNKTEGEAFLAENKTKPGVITLPDGLQYRVISSGSGATPTVNDKVVVDYRGTFLDGTEFDSSARLGQPAEFEVSHLIRGWQEALMLMKAGSKWQVFVPADLAYGQFGQSPRIAPNATLIFEVELVSVQPQAVAAGAPLTSDIIKVPSAAEMKKGAKIEIIKPADAARQQ